MVTTQQPAVSPPQQRDNLGTLQGLLEKYKDQIAAALPRHLTPSRMIRVTLTAVSQNQRLKECNPYTICGAVVMASILGLEVNSTLGEAFLVPYWNKKANNGNGGYDCQLQVGYKGHVKLARNSGEIAMVDAQPVCKGDTFDFEKGDTPYLRHKWGTTGTRGEIIGYWAGFKTKDGTFNFEYWTLDEIYLHRDKYSKSKDKKGEVYGPWVDSPDWMCRKTVLIQVLKLAPKSVQLATALAVDEHPNAAFSVDVPPELQPAQDDDPPPSIREPQRKSQQEAAAADSAVDPNVKPKVTKPPAKMYDFADRQRAEEGPEWGNDFIKVAGKVYQMVEGNYREYVEAKA